VLVVGGTGHLGRVFLEQGLAMYGDQVEFRVLARSPKSAEGIPAEVKRVPGDIRDIASLRKACEGFTAESIVFDSSTYINLAYSDPDGSIVGTNLDGPLNVLEVARELGCMLQKAHSQAGLAAPRSGTITEDTPTRPELEEDVYVKVPYLLSKKQVTRALLAAQADGACVMVSYLVTPWGPYSRADALTLNIIDASLRYGRYVYPAGVGQCYIDARDAAKVHWLAYMNSVYDHVVLSEPLSKRAFVDLLAESTGVPLKMHALSYRVMLAVGDAMDWLQRRVMTKTTFPVSNAIVKLMFANNAYSSQKARDLLGYAPRPAAATFGDHFQDLINRGLVDVKRPHRAVSIW
jgi:nucleoside-diphosphate-sugar epimerase